MRMLMRCGRIAVQEDDDDAAALPLGRNRNRGHRRRPNPWSDRGVDQFQRLRAELSRRRAAIAATTGAPPQTVRFIATNTGWAAILPKSTAANANANANANAVGVTPPAATAAAAQKTAVPWGQRLPLLLLYWSRGVVAMRRFIAALIHGLGSTSTSTSTSAAGVHPTTATAMMMMMSSPPVADRGKHLLPTASASTVSLSARKGLCRTVSGPGRRRCSVREYRRLQSLDENVGRRKPKPYAATSESYVGRIMALPLWSPPQTAKGKQQRVALSVWVLLLVVVVALVAVVFFGRIVGVLSSSASWYALPLVASHTNAVTPLRRRMFRRSLRRVAIPGQPSMVSASPSKSKPKSKSKSKA